jgi:hypothetical protein
VDLYTEALDLIPKDDDGRRREVTLKQALAYARFTHLLVDWRQLRPDRQEADAGPGST